MRLELRWSHVESLIAAATTRLEALERDLAEAFTRWESLEAIAHEGQ